MIKIRTQILTASQARQLDRLGFVVKFVTMTVKGLIFDIYVQRAEI